MPSSSGSSTRSKSKFSHQYSSKFTETWGAGVIEASVPVSSPLVALAAETMADARSDAESVAYKSTYD